MTQQIDNTQDMIDSRDFIEYMEELKDSIEAYDAEVDADEQRNNGDKMSAEREELAMLEKVAAEASGSPDWTHGEQMIRKSHFVDYIEQLIDDCYSLPKELTSGDWPYRHITIDYKAAADEAEADYIEFDFDGEAYLIRA